MSLKGKLSSLWSNIEIKRGHEEVVGRKTFYLTNAFLAFCIGFLLGIVVLILQETLEHDACELALNIIIYCVLALGVAGNIWYLLPLFRSEEPLWIKIVRPILGIVLFTAMTIVGIYAFIALLVILVVYIMLKLALKFMFSGSSSSESKQRDPHYDVELSDGTKLTQTDFGGFEFSGNDGYKYVKNDAGEFCRVD